MCSNNHLDHVFVSTLFLSGFCSNYFLVWLLLGVAVGFSAMVTMTSEAAGTVNVTVELLQGVLDANVEVEVFVVMETGDLAEGKILRHSH